MRKELKDRGVTLPASAKKSDLVAKLKEILEATGGHVGDSSGEDLLNASLEDLTGHLTSSITTTGTVSPVKTTGTASNGPSTTSSATIKLVKATPSVSAPTAVATGEASDTKTVTVAKTDNTLDRMAARAARFGITSQASSLSSTKTSTLKTAEELAALKKRSERFGEVVSDTVKTLEVKEKLNQRANRFNLSEEEASPAGKLGLVKKAVTSPKRPASSSLTPEEEERIKKRRERFGLV